MHSRNVSGGRGFAHALRESADDLRIARVALLVVLVSHLVLGLVYNFANPLFESPDEIWHYVYVRHLAEGKGLPRQVLRWTEPLGQQEGGQPPLYYVIAAALTFWAPKENIETLARPNPLGFAGNPKADDNKNLFVHGPNEDFPWQGEVWAVHLARLVATLFGSATVLLTYAIGRELWPTRPDLAVGAAAMNAFVPQFLFIGAAANNDVAAAATSSLALFMSIRLMRSGPTGQRLVLTGLALSLAILTKFGGPTAIALSVVALAWWYRRQPGRVERAWMMIRSCTVLLALVVVLTGWWYARNLILYGELMPLKIFLNLEQVRYRMPPMDELVRDLPGLWMSTWALFGPFNILVSSGMYTFYSALSLIALCGLAIIAWRHRGGERLLSAPVLLLPLWALVIFAALMRYRMLVLAFQGRLLFPAISAMTLLLYLGLSGFAPGRWRWLTLPAVAIPMLVIAAVLPWQVIMPAYARPQVHTSKTVGTPSYPVTANFGDQLHFLGYDLSSEAMRPGDTLTVTVYWRAVSRMSEDYAVFVHLRDRRGGIIAQYGSFPAGGNFATSLWSPDDALRDPIRLRVPSDINAPIRAQLFVGLEESHSGRWVRVAPVVANEQVGGDALPLGFIRIVGQPPAEIPNPRDESFGGLVALAGFSLDDQAVHPGGILRGRLFLRAQASMDRDYTVFVHLTREPLMDASSIISQQDRQPYDGAYPTSAWRVGESLAHDFALTVPPDTPSGEYVLRVGLYDLASGHRLPAGAGDHVRLGTITIRP